MDIIRQKNEILFDLHAAKARGDKPSIQRLSAQSAELEEKIACNLPKEEAVINLISAASCYATAGAIAKAIEVYGRVIDLTQIESVKDFARGEISRLNGA